MDFREATDGVCVKVDHHDVARALGVSLQTVRQARVQAETRTRRPPPTGWREAVIRIAEEKASHYQRLIDKLRASADDRP